MSRRRARCRAALLALLLAGAGAGLHAPAAAQVSFFPLPAIDTDPSAGNTYGVLPVILFRTEEGGIRSIVAPSVTYNEFRGITGTFRYYLYPSPLERVDVIGSYSETIDRKLDLYYRNLGLLGDRFHTEVQLLHDKDSTVRFFGLGPLSRRETETNMTYGETSFNGTLGVNLTPYARLSLGETVAKYTVTRGSVPSLPFTRTVFPNLPGVDGAFVHAQRMTLMYDSRDSQMTPTRGMVLALYTEASAKLLGSDNDFIKSGVDVTYLHPTWDGRVVLVGRGRIEALTGDADTPFQVLPSLGGGTTLRGFAQGRFVGDASVLINLEARIRLFAFRIFGVQAEFQAAPFVDLGRVFSQVQDLRDRLEVTPGIGFRGLVAPSVVGHIEIGAGREGAAIFVGLDYPF